MRRTKIVCTVGPATSSEEKLGQLIRAGADVFRLNFSHGSPDEHVATLKRIRAQAERAGKPIAVLQDLPGPKIRLGDFEDGEVELKAGERFTLAAEEVAGDSQRVSISYSNLPNEVHPGQHLILGDGSVELEIEDVRPPEIRCRVLSGGCVSSRKGITPPRGTLNLPAFTDEDREFLEIGIEAGVDLAALSFVRSPEDVVAARDFLEARKADIPLMAKIEKAEAIDAFDAILDVVDAVMVARGDLGVDLSPAEVPMVQKDLILRTIRAGKPVVTATQMLGSMVSSPRPTRAEAADVANAVLDGTDAVMLSEESAVGKYPIQAVRMLAEIAAIAERHIVSERFAPAMSAPEEEDPSAAMGHAASILARNTGAAAIVCCTRSGRTAELVSKYRPEIPILAVSPRESTVRRLMLSWGVTPVATREFESTDDMVRASIEAAKQTGLVGSGARVVVVGAAPSAEPGRVDFVRLVRVS